MCACVLVAFLWRTLTNTHVNLFLFLFFLILKLIFIGVWLIYNAVLVSGVQQSESVTHIHISTLF